MSHSFSKIFLLASTMTLAGCGGGNSGGATPTPPTPPAPSFPTGADAGGSGSAGDGLSGFGMQGTFQPTAHQGLEELSVQGGGFAVAPTPTLTLQRTTTGFNASVPGATATYDTRSGSRNISGQNQYRVCTADCGTANEQTAIVTFTGGTGSDLTASTYGTRQVRNPSGSTQYFAVFATGLPTASASLPTTGVATYTGGMAGQFFVAFNTRTYDLTGEVTLNANFAGRTIDGRITNIVSRLNETVPAGSVTGSSPSFADRGFTGDIVLSGGTFNGASFSGTANAAAIGGPGGQFGGSFHGADGGEAAGSFAISSAATNASAAVVGSFGARRLGSNTGTAPTDPLAGFTTQTVFTPTAHRGLEIIRKAGGLAPLASPTLTFTRTATGFTMALSQGNSAFDTRAGSSNVLGGNRLESCIDGCTSATATRVGVAFNGSGAVALDYATFGTWTVTPSSGLTDYGVFATGLATTTLQLPATGSATFTGNASGYIATSAQGGDTTFSGDAVLNANFGARTVTGAVSSITTRNVATPNTTGVLGDIQFSGGTFSGTNFAGAATPSIISGAAVDLTGASGQFSGSFFGPAASEVAGSFTVANASLSLIGAFGARTPPAGVNYLVPGGPPLDPISALTARLSYTAQPGRGLEVSRNGVTEANPTPMTFARTSTGYTAGNVEYDTRSNATNYSFCSPCVSGLAATTYDFEFTRGTSSQLSYATYGIWSTRQILGYVGLTTFAVGIETLAQRMPTSGAATYTGGASGYVRSGASSFSTPSIFRGDAALTANFAAGAVTGAVTNIVTQVADSPTTTGTMSNLTFSAGSISGNGFTGIATGDVAPGATFNLGGATGRFGGIFYGPTAQEVAGSFALTGTGGNVIGAFGAKR